MFIAGAYRYSDINAHPVSLNSIVSLMVPELLHRNKQHYCIEDGKVYFCSNNLPTRNSSIILVYSGVFFNMHELKSQLSFPGDSSTEAVLKSAYKKWGHDFTTHITGEFTIAIYDRENQNLLLSRDRVGLRPLYYCYDNGVLVFASEVKALLKVKKKREINFRALHSGIVFGSVYSREHLIEGIYELRAGHNLIMNPQSKIPVSYKYWDRVFNITSRPFADYGKEFKNLLDKAVKKRLPLSKEKVGISFSGGIDSTLILALVKGLYSGPIETYTAVAEGDKLSEYKDARMVAANFQTKHREVFISTLEAIESFPKIIWHMSEFTTPHRLASIPLQTYFVGKLARENACGCIFTGNGVEHNFDGNGSQRIIYQYYNDSKKTPKFIRDKLIPLIPVFLRDPLRRKFSFTLTSEELDNIAGLYILANSWSWWRNESSLKSFYTKKFINSIGDFKAQDILSEYLKGCTAQDYFNKLLYIDFKTWNSRRNLVTNERLFGAFGVQLQIPFLDSDLIEFSSSMPVSAKHNFRDAKYFIRKVYGNRGILPKEVFKKGKRDSILRFNFWDGHALGVISYFVNEFKKRQIFREDFIDRVLLSAKKNSGMDKYRYIFVGLFEIELWFRIFVDNPDIKEKDLTLDYLGR